MIKKTILLASTITLLASCQSTRQHQQNVSQSNISELTIGIVQKEIHEGMAQAEVIESLGSPNIVTKDKNGVETWVYDKIASEASYSQDSGGLWLILTGYQKSAGSTSSSERTLTLIIKFNPDQEVDSFSYHSSKF